MAFSTDFTQKSGIFHRFNAKNWRFSVQILLSKNFASVKKMTNIRHAHPAARNLGNLFTLVFAPIIESVEINLGKAVPPRNTNWATFSLFKMCQNKFGHKGPTQFEPGPKMGCFFLDVIPKDQHQKTKKVLS